MCLLIDDVLDFTLHFIIFNFFHILFHLPWKCWKHYYIKVILDMEENIFSSMHPPSFDFDFKGTKVRVWIVQTRSLQPSNSQILENCGLYCLLPPTPIPIISDFTAFKVSFSPPELGGVGVV